MTLSHVKTRRWTVDEYRRLFERGVLSWDERVELIEGEIVEMAGMNAAHAGAIILCTRHLVLAFQHTHHVACQVPVEASRWSEPQPDFALIPNAHMNFGHPIRYADLVIEVSDTTVSYDRHEKASVYAKWAVPEYWILNVRRRRLEVYRSPRPDPKSNFGFGWSVTHILTESHDIEPLCAPNVTLHIQDLLVPKA